MTSRLLAFSILALSLVGCSNAAKMRAQEREKVSLSSGLYCDFVNGDEYADVEVQLNIEMAKRCDAGRDFTLTSYKNSSEIHGLVYCCALARKDEKPAPTFTEIKPEAAKVAPPAPKPAPAPVAAPVAPPVPAPVTAKPVAAPEAPAPKAAPAPAAKPAPAKPAVQVINSGDDLLE